MHRFIHLFHQPAGRIGLTIGLVGGLLAALMGEGSKALLFISLCRFLARHVAHPSNTEELP